MSRKFTNFGKDGSKLRGTMEEVADSICAREEDFCECKKSFRLEECSDKEECTKGDLQQELKKKFKEETLSTKRFQFLSTLPDYEFFNVCIKSSCAWSYQMFIPLFLAGLKEPIQLRVLRTAVYLMDLKVIDAWYKQEIGERLEEGLENFAIDIFKEHLDLEQLDWDYFERLIRAHCRFSVEKEFQPLRSRLLTEERSNSISEDVLNDIYEAYCNV
jgi:hypothetical protein